MKHAVTARRLTLVCLLIAALLPLPAAAVVPTPNQINLDIGTPPVIVMRHALTQRQSRLVRFYEAGVMGLDINGMVKIHDTSKLNNLTLQQIAGKLIDQENPDRMSLIYAISEAHGGKEAVPVVKQMMAKRWRDEFKPGWWLEDENGQWRQIPNCPSKHC